MTAKTGELPLVSIVVPVFNGEQYLRESLDSILAQSYPRTEVLVMDNASTDRTPEIVASYGARVKYHRQPQNRGLYQNMNDGIAISGGEYIAIYHADDIYEPAIVEREAAFLDRYPEAGAVFCADIFMTPDGREYGRLELPDDVRGGEPLDYPAVLNALLTYKNRFLRCPSCMARASLYREVGEYDEGRFGAIADLEMYLRMARQSPIGVLEEWLYRYRSGHNSSARRYYYLRTEEDRFFTIMDLFLNDGGRAIATPQALADYEAHRDEDRLMIVISHYILDRCREARLILHQVRLRQLLASARVQRGRLLLLYLALQLLVRLPRIRPVGDLFHRRWHGSGGLSAAPVLTIHE